MLQRAVQELQDRHNVAVVDADSKVSVRSVKVGPRVDDLWVIDEGLKPGERVVVEGLQRLRDGMTVNAVPVAASAPQPAPHGPRGTANSSRAIADGASSSSIAPSSPW